MKSLGVLLKLLASLALIWVGYFIHAAVGWPGRLDAMVTERALIGGAFALLGGLCLVAILLPIWKAHLAGPSGADESAPALVISPDSAPDPTPGLQAGPAAEPDVHADATLPEPAPAVAPTEPLEAPLPDPPAQAALAPARPAADSPAFPMPAPPLPDADFNLSMAETWEPPLSSFGQPPMPVAPTLAAVREQLGVGDGLCAEGRLEEALEPYGEALDMARVLQATAPNDQTLEVLASAIKAMGDVNDQIGRLNRAASYYEEALALHLALLREQPDLPGRKRSASLALERLGDIHEARGHTSRALTLYRQSLALAQALALAEPGDRVGRENLAATQRRIAELEAGLAS